MSGGCCGACVGCGKSFRLVVSWAGEKMGDVAGRNGAPAVAPEGGLRK